MDEFVTNASPKKLSVLFADEPTAPVLVKYTNADSGGGIVGRTANVDPPDTLTVVNVDPPDTLSEAIVEAARLIGPLMMAFSMAVISAS